MATQNEPTTTIAIIGGGGKWNPHATVTNVGGTEQGVASWLATLSGLLFSEQLAARTVSQFGSSFAFFSGSLFSRRECYLSGQQVAARPPYPDSNHRRSVSDPCDLD